MIKDIILTTVAIVLLIILTVSLGLGLQFLIYFIGNKFFGADSVTSMVCFGCWAVYCIAYEIVTYFIGLVAKQGERKRK